MADFETLDKERQESIQYLSKPWHTFFKKFKQIETLEVHEWKLLHFLAYFEKRFREAFNKNYSYTYYKCPSKCTEMVLIKQLFAMLCTTSNKMVKDYIDWIFDKKIIPGNIKIKSISFLKTNGFGNEFRQNKAEREKIRRSTELPGYYVNVVNEFNLPVATFGDLAFIKMALNKDSGGSTRQQYKMLFDKLYAVGFEDNMIKDLI